MSSELNFNCWRKSTWGNEISLEYGKSLRDYQVPSGKYRVFGSNGAIGWSDSYLSLGPGVILGRKGAYRGVRYSDEPFFVIDTAYYVVPKNNDLDLRWLYYAIQHHKLGEIDDGSPIPSTTRAAVYVRELSVPPLEVQKTIANALRPFDEKIELNRQTNQTLEQIAQALFKSWFVDFEPTRAKIAAKEAGASTEEIERAAMCAISGKTPDQLAQLPPKTQQNLKTTAALFPDALVDSELGEIPAGWEVKKIEDVIVRLKPSTRYGNTGVLPYGKVPVYEQGAGILLGYHNETAGFNASPEEPMFIFGDHTCVTHLSCEPFDVSQNVIPLSGKNYPTVWVYYAIQGKQEFQEYRRHWSELIIKEIVVPSHNISVIFSQKMTQLYLHKEQLIRESKSLEQIRDSLLPKLLSGELAPDEILET